MKIKNYLPSILIYFALAILSAIALMIILLALAISFIGTIIYFTYKFVFGNRTVYVNRRNIS
jgi:hypothetical protein